MDEYTPLHVHTDASSDGLGTVQALVERAKDLGMTSLAMTDHGTLANAISFWSACVEQGIKPILGLEAYLQYEDKRHHLTLLARNRTGFENLIELDTRSHLHSISGYPTTTLSLLNSLGGNLFVLTGCPASAIHREDKTFGKKFVLDLCQAVGKSNVFCEVMFASSFDYWTRPLEIAEELSMAHVVTNDTHFPLAHQFASHQILTSVRKGYTYNSEQLWLKSAQEILDYGSLYTSRHKIEAGLEKTNYLAGLCSVWDMRAAPSLPSVPKAREMLLEAVKLAYKSNTASRSESERTARLERLRREFRELEKKGFLDYVYILWDIVKWAKNKLIRVGPGRGSGAGSYVLYLLGITQIDPIDFGLHFERFLNPERTDYPDVDVDFDSNRRQEVLDYAKSQWGAVPIATYSTYSHKSAVHDIARIVGIDKEISVVAAERGKSSVEFEKFCEEKPTILPTYNAMLGQIRHRGKHAGGVVITSQPVPLEKAGDVMVAAWTEGENRELSKVGIVKYDLLGVSALTQLEDMEKLSGVKAPLVPDNDPKVLELFQRGEVNGIFQWTGSEGIREFTRKLAPNSFLDLVAINALYRPGALDAGTAEKYPEYKKKPRKLHPQIDPLLTTTYGVICYQEQVMSVVAEVTGSTFGEADLVRRLISKAHVGNPEWEKQMRDLHKNFMGKGEARGFDRKLLETLWEEIYTHSRYSFNLSHAAAYSLIAWQMAFFKAHYPGVFFTAMLRHDTANAQGYLYEAAKRGIAIYTPKINVSGVQHELRDNAIYLPLTDVKFFGEKMVKQVIEEREKNGEFLSFEDFSKRVAKRACNSRNRTSLYQIGAFTGFADSPDKFLDDYASLPLLGDSEAQQEILGYTIPTPRVMWLLERFGSEEDYAIGFVRGWKDKKNKKGQPYRIFYLSPEGSFWLREDFEKYAEGNFLVVKKTKWGMGKQVKRMTL